MTQADASTLAEPRFEAAGPIPVAGLGRVYAFAEMGEIPALWERIGQQFGSIPGQVGMVAYGVNYAPPDGTGDFGYLAAAEISDTSALPDGFTQMRIPAHRYAVFTHAGHVSQFPETIQAAMGQMAAHSGNGMPKSVDGIIFFERYAADFDPEVGIGGMEVWFPVERS